MKFVFTDHFRKERGQPRHELTAAETVEIVQLATSWIVEHHRRGRHVFQRILPGQTVPARAVVSASTSGATPVLTIITSYFVTALVSG